ncbi:MAG TPA: NAD-dependent epimerase/dehydratase family protein [Kofleriaceae bacterium]|nr:NAD-dependent epimerase/dehydratase family protein [Kofleriaceae bacterium]
MSTSRRNFTRRDLLRGGLAAAALGLTPSCSRSGTAPGPQAAAPPPAPVAKKRILILGGTGFLGPKTIDAALARGHTVTIFNRGKREKYLPLEAKVEHLYGNRDPNLPADDERDAEGKLLHPDGSPKGLEQLAGKSWDVVIDNSGFFPRLVKASAELLAKNAAQYIYISSISAYAENPPQGGDERTKLATLADPTVETMGKEFENYGGLKALCEQAAEAAFPGRATIVRPGYIVGPGDPTDRFTYWPVRVSRGGEVLAPGSPADPLQWIDVRDLGAWLVTLAERGTAGQFNAVGPPSPGRWGDVLDACVAATGGTAKLTWVPSAWLEKNEMGGEDAFPIWIAPSGKFEGFHRWSNDRAEAAGLTFRPIADTVKSLLAWYPGEVERRVRVTREMLETAKAKGLPPPKTPADPSQLRAGPKAEDEQALLAKWKASGGK